MKLPQPAPNWHDIVKADGFVKIFGTPEVLSTVQRYAADKYPYWDTLRHLPMPNGVAPEIVWAARELTSLPTRRFVPFLDAAGQPFSFWLPDKAQELLHRIDKRATGPVLTDGQPIHAPERYIAHSLEEEAIASSQIEGAATTRDAAKEMLQSGRRPLSRGEKMIANNYKAIQTIRSLKNEPITVERICELQAILTEGTLPDAAGAGRLRQSPADDDIVVEDTDDGIILHRPPRPGDLPNRLKPLISFANSNDETTFIHPVIKAIILHFWIGYEHPFVDGNGRTARAVFYWYLLKQNYWLFEYLSISQIVHRSYGQYKKAFLYSEVRPGSDMTYFIMYNLRVISLAIEQLLHYIEARSAQLQRASLLLRTQPQLNHRQRELLIDALKNPTRQYSIKAHQATHQVSYQTARTDLFGLKEQGFLEMLKDGRVFVFVPDKTLEERIKNPGAFRLE